MELKNDDKKDDKKSTTKDVVVIVGAHTVTLRPPKGQAIAWDILSYRGINGVRAACAALGACWRGEGRPKASYTACGFSPGAYGGQVMEELLERGVKFGAMVQAGEKAVAVLTSSIVTADEVDEAEGFTGADEEESTG